MFSAEPSMMKYILREWPVVYGFDHSVESSKLGLDAELVEATVI